MIKKKQKNYFNILAISYKKYQILCIKLNTVLKYKFEFKMIAQYPQLTDTYEKIQKIGEGSFGKVYFSKKIVSKTTTQDSQNQDMSNIQKKQQNEKQTLMKYYALKKLKNVNSETEIQQMREICNLKKFTHKNLVKLQEIVQQNKEYKSNRYIAMEYGLEILQFAKHKEVHISKPNMKQILFQIVKAVQYLHGINYIHRDIKPSNIYLYPTGRVCLGDFSITRKLPVNSQPLTRNITTRYYRAPEIIYGEKHYSFQIDIWALGCTICQLIIHQPIFPGQTDINQLECIYKIIGYPQQLWKSASQLPFYLQFPEEEPIGLKSVLPDIQDELLGLIQSMLQLDPKKRLKIQQVVNHPYFSNMKEDLSELSKIATYLFQKKIRELDNPSR